MAMNRLNIIRSSRGGERVLRVFKCSCGHYVRFGVKRCGYCWKPTSLINRTSFYFLLFCIALFLMLYMLAAGL